MPSAEPSTPVAAAPPAYERKLVRPTFRRRAQWHLETWAYTGIEFLLGSLPAVTVSSLGRALGGFAHMAAKSRRRIVMRNLRIAFADERSAGELETLGREVFKRAGANLLSALRTARLNETELAKTVRVENLHYIAEATVGGKGLIMVLAHMGNWEALAQWLPKMIPPGMPAADIYRPLNNPILDARINASRLRQGLRLFSKDQSPLAMASFLRNRGGLGIMSDQRAGRGGELVPFFGRLTSGTPLPAVLARRTGAAVLGLSLRTIAAGRWELKLHKLEGEPTTGNVMALVERMMRESPADVFWLQDRWRIEKRTPHIVPGKIPRAGSETSTNTKRRRALLWADASGAVPARPAAEPADLDYEAALPEGAEAPKGVTKLWIRETLAAETPTIFLNRVNQGAALPLDFVVTGPQAGEAVREACKKLGLGWMSAASA